MMKVKPTLTILFSLLAIACKKDQSRLPPAEPPKVDKSFPAPTCNDTTDDFKFEHWDTSKLYYKVALHSIKTADTENLHSYDTFYFTGHTISNFGDSLKVKWIQKNRPTTIVTLTGDSTFLYIWHHSNLPDGAYQWNISASLLKLTKPIDPGCYRIYYVLADSTYQAETQGHYDIEIQ